jgi:hypothetical protein
MPIASSRMAVIDGRRRQFIMLPRGEAAPAPAYPSGSSFIRLLEHLIVMAATRHGRTWCDVGRPGLVIGANRGLDQGEDAGLDGLASAGQVSMILARAGSGSSSLDYGTETGNPSTFQLLLEAGQLPSSLPKGFLGALAVSDVSKTGYDASQSGPI